jgi:hypothetical protein
MAEKNESPEGVAKKTIAAIPGDEDVEGHSGKKSILDGGPEGVAKKTIANIPDGEDDVEGHSANKRIWGGEPDGVAKRTIANVPDSADDDVEGHVFDLSRGSGGELIDRKIPGGDSPHGEGVAKKDIR